MEGNVKLLFFSWQGGGGREPTTVCPGQRRLIIEHGGANVPAIFDFEFSVRATRQAQDRHVDHFACLLYGCRTLGFNSCLLVHALFGYFEPLELS